MRLMGIVDDLIVPILLTITAAIGAVIFYVSIAAMIGVGLVIGAAWGCSQCGFDLFAWIGGL